MVTGMDSLVAQGRRGELTREIDSGRLARRLRNGPRPDRGRRWAFWLPRETDAPTGMPASPKIRCLHDAGAPART
jgi:hypothetical protein